MKTTKFFVLILFIALSYQAKAIIFESWRFKATGTHYAFREKNKPYYARYINITSEKITLVYDLDSAGITIFKGILISKPLEQKIPMLVVTYIGEQVARPKLNETHSLQEALDVIRVAVERALDQRYKNLVLTEGSSMVRDSAYFRGHCNTDWWMPNYYYDFEPAFSDDTVKTFATNTVSDAAFPGLQYLTDTLKNFNYHHDAKNLSKWGDVFRKVRNTSGQRTIRDYGFVRSSIKNDNTYHHRSDSCRFTFKKIDISHGKRYPVFASVSIFGWHATYCNFFASDLRKAVFGTSVWQTQGCKADSEYLSTNPDFVKIPRNEIVRYSETGYFVLLIDEGHIATVYPNGQTTVKANIVYPYVIQAGAHTGIVDVFTTWSNFDGVSSPVKYYIYLGHLKGGV